jgi:hypothetical protein
MRQLLAKIRKSSAKARNSPLIQRSFPGQVVTRHVFTEKGGFEHDATTFALSVPKQLKIGMVELRLNCDKTSRQLPMIQHQPKRAYRWKCLYYQHPQYLVERFESALHLQIPPKTPVRARFFLLADAAEETC